MKKPTRTTVLRERRRDAVAASLAVLRAAFSEPKRVIVLCSDGTILAGPDQEMLAASGFLSGGPVEREMDVIGDRCRTTLEALCDEIIENDGEEAVRELRDVLSYQVSLLTERIERWSEDA